MYVIPRLRLCVNGGCVCSGDTDAYAGTCHSPFPTHSHTRAHKEYHRFSQLSQEEQRCELLELAKVKQVSHFVCFCATVLLNQCNLYVECGR